MSNVMNKMGWVLAGIVSLLVVAAVTGIVHGGPLDPPAAPSSTDGVRQPGTPISSLPYTISTPGNYYVTRNLTNTFNNTDGITIEVENVTLDLGGFTLDGGGNGHSGIFADLSLRNLVVRNGNAEHWTYRGVDLQTTASSLIENVQASNDGDGIWASGATIKGCSVYKNSGIGIRAQYSTIIGCTASLNATGFSVYDTSLTDCASDTNTGTGIDALRSTVQSCSVDGNYYGIVGQGTNNIRQNTVLNNTSDGIRLTAYGATTVADNNVSSSGASGSGIFSETTNNRITHNNVVGSVGPGIQVVSSFNTIDDNSVLENNGTGILVVGGSKNTVIRNSSLGNGSPVLNYNIAAGNNPGPITAANTATNPLSNTQ